MKVHDGLNLFGKCKTRECIAYKEKVLHKLGLGFFNIAKEKELAKCPCCKQKLIEVTNMVFSKCKYKVEGMSSDGKEYKLEEKTARD